MSPDSAEKGQLAARTQPAPAAATAARDDADPVAAVLAQIAPDPVLPGLVDDDAEPADMLGRVAEQVNAQRRARGRPEGSANKRNAEIFDYLEARGFKQPERFLAEIVTADPRALAAALSGPNVKPEHVPFDKALEVMRLQAKAAADLLPYKLAKRQELKVEHTGKHVHLMVAGRLTAPGQGPATAFSLTCDGGENANEINAAPEPLGQQPFGQDGQAVDDAGNSADKPAD